jgi:hypothetical protein
MRTTLTLDPDVAAALQRLSAERELTWKELVHIALLEGLHQLEKPRAPAPRYSTSPIDPGRPALIGVHSVHEMLAFAEREDYR